MSNWCAGMNKYIWLFPLTLLTINNTSAIALPAKEPILVAQNNQQTILIQEIKLEVTEEKATIDWIIDTYCQRNWIEVFFREIKGWLGLSLGLSEYQVRKKRSLMRHFILVFRCSHIYSMASSHGGIEKAMGK